MAALFGFIDRNTSMLLPPDLRDWVEEDDLVHLVIEAVDCLPLESFRVKHRGTGREPKAPEKKVGDSRRLQRAVPPE